MIVVMSISLIVEIEFQVRGSGRGGGSSGRTSRATNIAAGVARAATGSTSDLTGMTIAVGERTQQVTQSNSGMPLRPSGQHAASAEQAMVPGIGMARAIATLPKASDATANNMRKRTIMTRITGLHGVEVKRVGILLIRSRCGESYHRESSDGICRLI
jgi:hypothetical protein